MSWTILRDAMLRILLEHKVVGLGVVPKRYFGVTMTRKWRCKPLKSLKIGSLIRRLGAVGSYDSARLNSTRKIKRSVAVVDRRLRPISAGTELENRLDQ
jgi:hypothetical protein